MRWVPSITYNATLLSFTLPQKLWEPEEGTSPGSREAVTASGARVASWMRYDQQVVVTLRFTDAEYDDVMEFVKWALMNKRKSFTFRFDENDVESEYSVFLKNPSASSAAKPVRNANAPWVWEIELTLRSSDGTRIHQSLLEALPPVAVRLEVFTQPAGATGDVALTTQPVVRVVDQYGDLFPVDGLEVTAAGSVGGVVGTDTVATVDGVATFTDLGFADIPWVPAANRTLGFSATGVISATSDPVFVKLGNDLVAWYKANDLSNTLNGSNQLVTAKDLSGHGRDRIVESGTITKSVNQQNGKPGWTFGGGAWMDDLTIPLQGSMTWFAVFKITSFGQYQNLFDHISGGTADMWVFWDVANKWQVDGRLAGNLVAGTHVTMVVHFYISGGNFTLKVRVNGATILTQAGTVPTQTIPGAVGAPANATFTLFHRDPNTFPFVSDMEEFGFVGRSKDGAEAAMETYLRNEWATW